jgi:hypothetical protein
VAGMQDIPGGDLQRIVLGACHGAAGSHLVAAGGLAVLRCLLLKRCSYATTATLRVHSEGLDIAFPERFAIVYYRGPARLGANYLDEVAQEASAPGAVKGAEHVRFLRLRHAGDQIPILSQHAGRQDAHLLEGRRPGLDLTHLDLPSRLGNTVIHRPIMPPANAERAARAARRRGSRGYQVNWLGPGITQARRGMQVQNAFTGANEDVRRAVDASGINCQAMSIKNTNVYFTSVGCRRAG